MWLTLIVAETISASSGIGYMTMNAREFLQTDVVLLGIIVYALLGKLADVLTRAIEHRALAWHPSYQRKPERPHEPIGHSPLSREETFLAGQPLARPAVEAPSSARCLARGSDNRSRSRRVAKSFGARRVLQALDLRFRPGSFVAVVGRSGGGKTTLLRLIAGLDTPTQRRSRIAGAPVIGPAALASACSSRIRACCSGSG